MFDIKATVQNLRKSKNYFADGYSPAFRITENYQTSGRITLIDKDKLEYEEVAEAYINFLTPEVYPNSLWIGKEIEFGEADTVTGKAVVIEIYNHILQKKVYD